MRWPFRKDQKPSAEVLEKLHEGVAYRLSVLCLVFAFAFSMYGFISLDLIKKFDPSVTLLRNLLPRLLLNGIPYLILAWFARSRKFRASLRAKTAIVGVVAIFVIACFIEVWPLVYRGNKELYLYVHGANVFVFSITLFVASPPLALLLLQLASFIVLFMSPVSFILLAHEDKSIFLMFINDFALFAFVSSIISHSIYRLRLKLALADERVRSEVTPFIGSHVAQAIYDNRPDMLASQIKPGLVFAMDIRGFTQFKQNVSEETFREFLKTYHRIVSKNIGEFGGYLLKTTGDGHLAVFGVFDHDVDLSDIPGLDGDLQAAAARKKNHYFSQAFQAYESIANAFKEVVSQEGFSSDIKIGAALDYGPIETILLGDQRHKHEIDVSGEVVIRCARLEAYSKVLIQHYQAKDSLLIISPELANEAKHTKKAIQMWETKEQDRKVRDFPGIEEVYFYSTEKFSRKSKLRVAA